MSHLTSHKENINFSENFTKIEKDLIYLQSEIELTQLKTNIETNKPGEFISLGDSKDGKFLKYLYTIKTGGTPDAIRNKAVNKGLAKSKEGIQITNSKAIPYDENHKFSAGDKVYVRIPKLKESNTEIIEGMKCKGGEYFGIDISKFNEDIDLAKFKKWNREKWDSEKADTRGVSFVYIRASDGVTEDKKVGNHVNKIKEYNNDKTIKDNHEQISIGFYHRMNGKPGKDQANVFIKTYNKYKDTAGGTNLVPMLDLEGSRIKNTTKENVRNKALNWLHAVEEKTGIVPGIYVTISLYRDYIGNDARFNKYLTRIAAYPQSNKNTGREIGTANRINHKTGEVNIGKSTQKIIKPTMYQSSQEGTVDGAYVKIKEKNGKLYKDTDMDHTKDIRKLFAKNNKTKTSKQKKKQRK